MRQSEMNKWQLDTPLVAALLVALAVLGIEYALGWADEHLIATFNLSQLAWDAMHGVMLAISLVPILYLLVFRRMREKEQRFQLLYDSARDAIITVNDQDLISGWNDAAQRMFQYRADEALGQPLHRMIAPLRYRDDAVRGFSHYYKTGEGSMLGKTIEIAALRKDGSEFPVELSVSSIIFKGHRQVMGIVRDITERKHSEKRAAEQLAEIERARLEWQAVFDTISDPIFIHDETLHITRANLAYARVAGMDIHEVIGQPYWKVFPRADGPMRSCQQAIEDSREEAEEFVVEGEVYLSRSFTTEKLPGAQYSVHIFENVTERKQAVESQLQGAKRLRTALEDMISAIAATLEQRDPYTAGHQRRVAELAVSIGKEMGLSGNELEGIHFGSLIHDIGKISVPAEILGKPGLLSDIEYALIKVHAEAGYEILKNVAFPWPVAQMVYQHHERLDGSGYPQGLVGEQIILEARIMAVSDIVEAMSANRPYRPGLGMEAALKEITRLRGTGLDPLAVDACLRVIGEQGFVFSK